MAYLMLGFKVPLEVFFAMDKCLANGYQRFSHLVVPKARDSCQQKEREGNAILDTKNNFSGTR
jgi:hypothetical protein